jgi:nucleoside-triphosphatase
MTGPIRILLEGRPDVGKTTVIIRLVPLLRAAGVPLGGFLTRERRERGRRVGFELETLDGGRGVLADVDIRGGPQVGRYGVSLRDLEWLAVPELSNVPDGGVAIIDELGKMELASEAFREAVLVLLERPVSVIATVHADRHPFTDEVKRRPSITVVAVTPGNRDDLPHQLAARLT